MGLIACKLTHYALLHTTDELRISAQMHFETSLRYIKHAQSTMKINYGE